MCLWDSSLTDRKERMIIIILLYRIYNIDLRFLLIIIIIITVIIIIITVIIIIIILITS